MSRVRTLLRFGAGLAVTGVLAVGATTVASAQTSSAAEPSTAGTLVPPRFVADSEDGCPMGYTEGSLLWFRDGLTVMVDGFVGDRPLANDPVSACGDDGRITIVTLTGKSGGRVVDIDRLRANNSEQLMSFSLTATVPIESVVVQVCRHTRPGGPADYCGVAQEVQRAS